MSARVNNYWIKADYIADFMSHLAHGDRRAVHTFIAKLEAAQRKAQAELNQFKDLDKILENFQKETGIISTGVGVNIPEDAPIEENSPLMNLALTAAGMASEGIGLALTALSVFNDLLSLYSENINAFGVLINASNSELKIRDFRLENAAPSALPLRKTIPPAQKILNPLDKKQYDCVAMSLFGCYNRSKLEGIGSGCSLELPLNQHVSFGYSLPYGAFGAVPGVSIGRFGSANDALKRAQNHRRPVIRPVHISKNILGMGTLVEGEDRDSYHGRFAFALYEPDNIRAKVVRNANFYLNYPPKKVAHRISTGEEVTVLHKGTQAQKGPVMGDMWFFDLVRRHNGEVGYIARSKEDGSFVILKDL